MHIFEIKTEDQYKTGNIYYWLLWVYELDFSENLSIAILEILNLFLSEYSNIFIEIIQNQVFSSLRPNL